MAFSLPYSLCGVTRLPPRQKFSFKAFKARAQGSHGDQGKSSTSIVDTNMGLLKERIEKVRMEERSDKFCKVRNVEGWNYKKEYDCQLTRRDSELLVETLKVAELVVGTVGFTVLSCTFCLCLVSFLVHLC